MQALHKTYIVNRMSSSEKISLKFTNRIKRGGTANSDEDVPRSCHDSGNLLLKNLPIHSRSRLSTIANTVADSAQNSSAARQNKKSDDLSCQERHKEHKTEFPEELRRIVCTNQDNSPRSNTRHQTPNLSMTLQPSQNRFMYAANGQQNHNNNNLSQQHKITPTSNATGNLLDISPSEQVLSSSDTRMKKAQHYDLVPTMEPEVDTQETILSGTTTLPLHRMLEIESQSAVEEHLAKIAAAERRFGTASNNNGVEVALQHRRQVSSQSPDTSPPVSPTSLLTPPKSHKATPSFVNRMSSRKHKKLTLSAYRKPEETVRLTDCDASRLLENEYDLRAPGCKVIGHGAFSTVRSALRSTDGAKVAIKSISKFDALRARRFRRPKGSKHMDEWEIMKLLRNNPHVLKLFDVFETEEEIHLVTEYCRGGELFDAIKRKSTQRSSFRRGRFSESQAARITNQILKALVELHALGIVHRDIKAENILLLNSDESHMKVKLCDFGMARLYQRCQQPTPSEISSDGESSPSTPGLSFGYSINAPPEGCRGSCIGPATDIFSLGATLYILLCGFPPVFCDKIVEFPDAYWGDISEDAKHIVRSMLHHDPKQRISAKDALENAWIKDETNRLIRRSISANLELVRDSLLRNIGDSSGRSPSLALQLPTQSGASKRRGFGSSTTGSGPSKRSRISSLDISLQALYEKRDVRVIEERVESRATCS